MVLCAAFGCNNRGKKGSDVNFFRFPKDIQLQKAWIHYCRRWDFTPNSNHRLCSAHFSKTCYERDPVFIKEIGCSPMRAKLLPNAVPDVPLATTPNQSSTVQEPVKRGAFEKRRKAEILQEIFSSNINASVETENEQPPVDEQPLPCGVPSPPHSKTVQTSHASPPKPKGTMTTKKSQTNLRLHLRTRRSQTEPFLQHKRNVVTVGTQTDGGPYTADVTPRESKVIHSDDNEDSESSEDTDSDPDYQDTDEDMSSDDDQANLEFDEPTINNYKLEPNPTPTEEKQFLISESALCELLSVCRYCCGEATSVVTTTKGTMIVTNTVCRNGHVSIWRSQAFHNNMPWGNLMTATAILLSGANASTIVRLCGHLNMQMFSLRTYSRLQSFYVAPAAISTWDREQANLLQAVHGQDVIVGGDARCDSPGYSAKYGSYTIMDLQTKKILDFQLVQCNEVKGSTHMELEGLKRSLTYLKDHVNVTEVVTDRHSSIKKYMRTEHADKHHLFDVWHVAKGISKKLEAAAKKNGGQDIGPWIKSISNHVYWISSSSGMDGNLKTAKWCSIVNHISNKHEGHSPTYPKCEHGELSEDRQWIKEGTVPYKRMQAVIENKFLLKDVPKLSPVYQTYALEVFHSIVNHFAPKSTHFFYPAMMARLSIAALHYNENSSRTQAKTKTGQLCYSMVYPKGKKGQEAVVKPRPTPTTYDYVVRVKEAVVARRLYDCSSYASASNDISVVNDHHPKPLTSSFQPFEKEELVKQHQSRFMR